MRTAEILLKILTSSLTHEGNGNSRSIGSNQCSRLPVLLHLFEYFFLNVEPFHHNLDDPVGLSNLMQIVFQVTGGDPTGKLGMVDGRGFGFERFGQRLVDQAVAHDLVFQAEPFFTFLFIEFPGNDIKEEDFHANIGKVAGDATSHDAGADYGHFFDVFFHVQL